MRGIRSHKPPAIFVEGGKKCYGKKTILDNFYMKVQEGTIYGLLGSSGCGKTTLLSCIVGLRKLNEGQILVCGKVPGSANSGVPGRLIGYMPQEVALNGEFTIKEACNYFGRLYGMDEKKVKERVKYLVDLLDLNGLNGQLNTFSGGQRRRASFAVALIHEPKILVLDEPTVGVDPLLRQTIWKHLSGLVAKTKTTVIITTHYIEETRSADSIGFMRNGRLIVEDSPLELLRKFNCSLLEDIVLRLCLNDEKTLSSQIEITNIINNNLDFEANNTNNRKNLTKYNVIHMGRIVPVGFIEELQQVTFTPKNTNSPPKQSFIEESDSDKEEDVSTHSFTRLRAMFIKNILVLFRSFGYLLFLFILPALQIILICTCLSSEPKHLDYAVINHEVPWGSLCIYEDNSCSISNLSCGYIQYLGKSPIVNLIPYENESLALEGILKGDLFGYLSIPLNFSDALFDRFSGGEAAVLNETVLNSVITYKMDMSNTQISLSLQTLFLTTYRTFVRALIGSCGENPEAYDIPLKFEAPVYGEEGARITNFVTPGVTAAFLSFLSSLTCGLAFISEKKDGMVHRTVVAGVKKIEIMLAHLATQFIVILVQTTISFLVMFLIFDIPRLGSVGLAYGLVILNGVAGMSLGFLAATYCDEEKTAMLIAIGTILPCFLVSGAIFPFEALPVPLQYVGYLVPGTMPGNAFRAILLKGWDITHFSVWTGFASSAAWIVIYWALTWIYHRFHK